MKIEFNQFKIQFEGSNPSGLSEEKIREWHTKMEAIILQQFNTPANCRKLFDNGYEPVNFFEQTTSNKFLIYMPQRPFGPWGDVELHDCEGNNYDPLEKSKEKADAEDRLRKIINKFWMNYESKIDEREIEKERQKDGWASLKGKLEKFSQDKNPNSVYNQIFNDNKKYHFDHLLYDYKKIINKLLARIGGRVNEENAANQGNNNSSNQNNSNNNENTGNSKPNIPFSTRKLAKEKVREAVNMANVALNGNSVEVIEKAREKLIEIQFNTSNKELQDEFNKNKGQELLGKLDIKERQIKNNKPEEKKPDNNNKNIQQAQTQTITEITSFLNNHNPKVSNNDLNPDYQNWQEQIKKLTDLTEIKNLKDKVIIDIQSKRESKRKTDKVSNDIDNTQGKSGAELLNKLKRLKENEGDRSFEENKQKVRELEQKAAQENPGDYRKSAIDIIKANMAKNEVREENLDNPEIKEIWNKLNSGEISEPAAIINAEEKITKKVGEVGAQKRFNKIVILIEKALTAPTFDKKSLQELREELLKFVSSTNIYDQSLYSNQKVSVERLVKRMENSLSLNQLTNTSSLAFPWKIAIPLSLLGVLAIALILIVSKKKNKLTRNRKK